MIFITVFVEVHFQDFFCQRQFSKMYLYNDRAENCRGPSKTSKGPCEGITKNPLVLLKIPVYIEDR